MLLEAALIIEGARVASGAGGTFECLDPVTGRVLTRAVAAEPADAERAAAAAAAFPCWSRMPGAERSASLLRAAGGGEICMSTERVIVVAGIADAFVDKFGALARQAATDRSLGAGPLVGPTRRCGSRASSTPPWPRARTSSSAATCGASA